MKKVIGLFDSELEAQVLVKDYCQQKVLYCVRAGTINSGWKLKLNKFTLKTRQIFIKKKISYGNNVPRTLMDSQTVEYLDTSDVCFYGSV